MRNVLLPVMFLIRCYRKREREGERERERAIPLELFSKGSYDNFNMLGLRQWTDIQAHIMRCLRYSSNKYCNNSFTTVTFTLFPIKRYFVLVDIPSVQRKSELE
jgi:hypothetical protein